MQQPSLKRIQRELQEVLLEQSDQEDECSHDICTCKKRTHLYVNYFVVDIVLLPLKNLTTAGLAKKNLVLGVNRGFHLN